ncbi:MAG: MATE family efflux transporter [Saprospiraceae bacterium]
MKKIKSIWSLFVDAIKGKEHEYTKGNINKAIFLLAIPMILELSLESVFALVDMFFVGKLGSSAIAIVGYTEAMSTLIYSVAIGLSTAVTAMIARRVGEKNHEDANIVAVQALILSFFLSLIVSIIGIVYSKELLLFMGATDAIAEQGKGFMTIMFGSNQVIMFLFLINGIFRGAGNAAIAMQSLWIASILNIVLDPIFIYGVGTWDGFGLEGAAIATVIGRGSGVLYQLYHMFWGNGIIKLSKSSFKFDFPVIKGLTNLAWPATFQFVIASGSWIVLTKLVADIGGAEASAGYQIAIRNVVFFILPAWGLSNAAATLVGQNLGANQVHRAEKSVLMATALNAIFMSFVMLFFVLLTEPIIRFFTQEEAVIAHGVEALSIIGSGFIFYGIGMVVIQSLNGAGDTKTPTWVNFIGFWLFQIPFAYVASTYFNGGVTSIFAAIPLAETFIAILAWVIFKRGHWKTIKI